jgi:hypothetical protein
LLRRTRKLWHRFVARIATTAVALFRRYREIWYALAAIVVITALYWLAYRQAGRFPVASGLVGHGIGIAGFILMLMTATLYTMRKRVTDARWGSTAGWLRFHMVTGLVGPYMVLLHTSMHFRALAGLAMLLTIVVVISGLIGRYIYTAVPRATVSAGKRLNRLATQRGTLATWRSIHLPLTWALFVTALVHMVGALYYVMGR